MIPAELLNACIFIQVYQLLMDENGMKYDIADIITGFKPTYERKVQGTKGKSREQQRMRNMM